MSRNRLMRIHSPEFRAMSERVLRVTELTSRLNVLPFEDEDGRAELLGRILGRPLPAGLTVYPPFFTDHGLHLDLAERCSSTRTARSWTTPASGSANV